MASVVEEKTQPKPLRLRRAAWKLCLAGVDMYALCLCIYFAARVLNFKFWPFAVMSTFLHLLLLPALILFPLMLACRRRPAAAMLGVNVLMFTGLFGALFTPQAAPPAGDMLTVMTANAGVAYHTPPEVLVEALRASGADIVGLQELSEPQHDAIERDLADLYPYRALYPTPIPDVTGKGLLSRYPIVEVGEPFRLRPNGNTHLRAVIDVNGRQVTVVVAHPPPPGLGPLYDNHPAVMEEIAALAALATADGPGLLVGDFNATDQNTRYTVVSSTGLSDAFRAAGWGLGPTWPVHRGSLPVMPVLRIDYIWHTPHFGAVEAWVGPTTGADHLPVVARLTWTKDSE